MVRLDQVADALSQGLVREGLRADRAGIATDEELGPSLLGDRAEHAYERHRTNFDAQPVFFETYLERLLLSAFRRSAA